nr:DNA adenine methylase [Mycoplasma elephantis]
MFLRGGSLLGYINSKKYVFNDINPHIISLVEFLYKEDEIKILNSIEKIISEYKLFLEIENNKKQINKENYNLLKKHYNQIINKNQYKAKVMLLTLVFLGFNSQIRFNKKNEFNIPAGKQEFNINRKRIFLDYVSKIKHKTVQFTNNDFKFIYKLLENDEIDKNAFFYFDPPYLITNATYNNIWSNKEENDLLNLLEELNNRKIKWALSNVFYSNGKNNMNLINWSKKYNVYYLDKTYKYSNYQRKNIGKDVEVLITNYEER